MNEPSDLSKSQSDGSHYSFSGPEKVCRLPVVGNLPDIVVAADQFAIADAQCVLSFLLPISV